MAERGARISSQLLGLLVCPRCRNAGQSPARLGYRGGVLECRRCRDRFMVEDGIPVILRDSDWRMPPADAAETALIANYVMSQFPQRSPSKRLARRLSGNRRLLAWIEAALARHGVPSGPALELGCGPGAYASVWDRHCPLTILSDLRLPFVKHARGHWAPTQPGRIVTLVCDAHDPPFRGASMSLVAAINLLDSTTEPWLLLGQIDALLPAGGICVLALPYVANFAGPPELYAALSGQCAELPWLSYTILESKEWLTWVIPTGERLVHEYQVHALVARKNAQAAVRRFRGP